MTDRLREIKERIEKAGPGAWEDDAIGSDGSWVIYDRANIYVCEGSAVIPSAVERSHNNRKLIARSRSDLPFLVSELEAALAENERLRKERDEAFARGAREGWMRCGVYHIDIDFEGHAEQTEEVNRRWPLATTVDPAIAAHSKGRAEALEEAAKEAEDGWGLSGKEIAQAIRALAGDGIHSQGNSLEVLSCGSPAGGTRGTES